MLLIILDLSYLGIVTMSALYMSAYTGNKYDDVETHWFALSIVFWVSLFDIQAPHGYRSSSEFASR